VIDVVEKKIIIVALLIACTLAVVAASADAATLTNDKINQTNNGGYIVKPVKSGSIGIESISDTITQGETNWHGKIVSGYTTTLNVDLNWGNSANSLQLTVISPEGYVFGPYYDAYDGTVNGRINVDIYNPGGIAQGTWYAKVYGYSVTGTQSYSI
jgi:hypothetical protein